MTNPVILLPFPSAKLSGHAKGGWRAKAKATKRHRDAAYDVALEVKGGFSLPTTGDIGIEMHFFPPDRRSDRVNFANRMKPYIDGIAHALGFNDVRLLPSYHYHDPAGADARVEVVLHDVQR